MATFGSMGVTALLGLTGVARVCAVAAIATIVHVGGTWVVDHYGLDGNGDKRGT
jgi:hypothetical protein